MNGLTKTFTESNNMTDKTVAYEIMRQLGGTRFILMTGARHFVADDKTLSFQIPRSNGIQGVSIKLNGMDTYDIEFCKLSKKEPYRIVIATANDIYFDVLQEVFTRYTGLATSL